MALEDFERELAKDKADSGSKKRHRSRSRSPRRDKNEHKRHHGKHHHHHRSRKDDSDRADSHHEAVKSSKHCISESLEEHDDDPGKTISNSLPSVESKTTTRDSWMETPSALDVEILHRKRQEPASAHVSASDTQQRLKVHKNELNEHLNTKVDGQVKDEVDGDPKERSVDYTFGDAGSKWRMSKLRAAYKQADESRKPLDEIALERFGDLETFDNAREEEIEIERRNTYGKGYVGKDKPSGDLHQERLLASQSKQANAKTAQYASDENVDELVQGEHIHAQPAPGYTAILDQTALNKLKAQMMRAKLSRSSEAIQLEAQYTAAISAAANNKQSDVVVLSKMESRTFADGRNGEVKSIDNKRGKERGHVEENEDMSIEDMVRQERRTRGQFSSGQDFAERIAKDAKFDNDLDYMDENASKLAKNMQKTDINLRNTAIGDFQKMKRILDTCPLCHHEDTSTPPQAPLVSLATRVFLTLPTPPEISPYGLCASIVPIQHRLNLLECDDDEWEEIRNFMKSLIRFFHSQKKSSIFYENAAHEGRKRHASMEVVAVPYKYGETAPAYFKEAILAADEEWTQHRKIINTMEKASQGGMGKLAFRRSMVSNLPYFHVWFTVDGGLGHVVEDARRWPKGDLFAREIIGGMLDVGTEIIKKQGRWRAGDVDMEGRVARFRKGWEQWDWTKALVDAS